MLPSKDIVTGSQRNRLNEADRNGKSQNDFPTGEDLARLFKYYRQLKDPGRNFSAISPNRVSARSFYAEHRKAFDAVSGFFASHGMDAARYVKFFVTELGKTGGDIDGSLFSRKSLLDYAAALQKSEKMAKVWAWFQKSVANIVDMCLKCDYMSGKDCVLSLIRSKRIAQEYVSGRISRYFFAAMPNFRNVIPKLDHFARAEFAELYDKFDIYNTEINNVFITYRNRTVNPLSIVDAELVKRRRSAAKSENMLFDPHL